MFADRVARIPVRETGEYRNARADRPRPEEALATGNATHELDRPGRPLPRRERESAERAFGADFARVRLHDDAAAHASAAALGARGWTWGDHVVLGHQAGPGTLMHELAHVVQQRAAVGGSASAGQPAGALEQDADHAAAERRLPSLRASGPLVQMQAESPQGGSKASRPRRFLWTSPRRPPRCLPISTTAVHMSPTRRGLRSTSRSPPRRTLVQSVWSSSQKPIGRLWNRWPQRASNRLPRRLSTGQRPANPGGTSSVSIQETGPLTPAASG